MIAVLQRVSAAAVRVEGETVGATEKGLLVLLGVDGADTREDADRLAAKVAKCRIFEDDAGRMNRSVLDVSGGALVISNFTLLADYHHGNRPSFFGAAAPAVAEELYLYFCDQMRAEGVPVATGVFGADMKISIEADGPVTIVMDSNVLKPGKEKKT